jgi:predicted dehydrogenase
MTGAEITAVSGMLSSHISERPDKGSGTMRRVTSDDEAKLMFRFADSSLTKNATGAAALSVVESGSYENRIEVYGSTGALMVGETGELWHSPAGSGTWKPVKVHQDPVAPGMRPASWSRGFAALSCEIVEALREGRTTIAGAASFEDGYRTQLVLDAARVSNRTRCWVDIDSTKP